MGQNDLCQQAGQPGKESFKPGLTGAAGHVREEVANYDGKQRVGHDVNRKDLVTNNTGWKGGVFKHIHVNKGVLTGKCDGESTRTFSGH